MATDEEIEEQRAVVETLREELENRRREREERQNASANDITLTSLMAEEARLRAQVAQDDWDEKRTSGKGASNPVNAAVADMERAIQLQKATADQLVDKPPAPPAPAAPVSPVPAAAKTEIQKGAK